MKSFFLDSIRKYEKVFFQFSKYTFVGICVTILNIFFMWLAIDVLNFNTMIATATIITVLFFVKFYTYVAINLIYKQLHKFLCINVISAVLNWIFAWFFIDIIGISAAISASIIVITLFILRFIAFKVSGLMK